jgi:tetratricopeptide (TPR) repeat protein
MTQSMFDSKLQALKQQIQQNPAQAESIINSVIANGDKEKRAENYKEAAEWYQMAIKLDPNNGPYKERLDAIREWLDT